MRNAKKILALAVALATTLSFAACGGGDSSSKATTTITGKDLDSSDVAVLESATDSVDWGNTELANTNVKWLAHYDINPADGKTEDPAIRLFKEKYKGTIEWVQTDWNSRYTKLASLVTANDAPDMFPADDMDGFPKGAINGMFQPIDSYIDLADPIWTDIKEACDEFLYKNGHYVAVIEVQPNFCCLYNTDTIDEMGVDQPDELYWKNKWNWDVFEEYCIDFTEAEADKYALDGYWYWNAISQTSGKSMISLNNGKLVSNLNEPALEEAQNFIYDLAKAGVGYPRHLNNWATRGSTDSGSEGIGQGLTLFIPVGLYEIEDTLVNTADLGSVADGEVMFVPMPVKDSENGTRYTSARVNGYFLCSGAKNPEGFAAFMRCKRIANTLPEVKELGLKTLTEDYGWTEDMVKMREELYKRAQENPVYEFYEAVSTDVSSVFGSVAVATSATNGEQQTWAEIRETYKKQVDYAINEVNTKVDEG